MTKPSNKVRIAEVHEQPAEQGVKIVFDDGEELRAWAGIPINTPYVIPEEMEGEILEVFLGVLISDLEEIEPGDKGFEEDIGTMNHIYKGVIADRVDASDLESYSLNRSGEYVEREKLDIEGMPRPNYYYVLDFGSGRILLDEPEVEKDLSKGDWIKIQTNRTDIGVCKRDR